MTIRMLAFGLLGCAILSACSSGPIATDGPTSMPTLAITPASSPSPNASATATEPAPSPEARLDLTYTMIDTGAAQETLQLDLYLPPLADPSPVLVYLHGGGWIEGSRSECPGEQLASHGYAVACVDYRLAQEGCPAWSTFPGAVIDVRTAVDWLRERADEFGLDATRVALIGDSSGGHLAALTALSPDVAALRDPARASWMGVQAVVDWYGPTTVLDAPPLFEDDPCTTPVSELQDKYGENVYAARAWGLFLGGSLADPEVRDRAELAAPATHADASDPPVLVIHGEADPLVPVGQSELLVRRLREVNASVTFVSVPGMEHSWQEQTGPEGILADAVREPTLAFLRAVLG
jgi:acetyl esterase/lipase